MESLSIDSIKSNAMNYISTFKQYPLWKKSLITSAIITGSSVVYTFGSYYYCKLRYPSTPRIYYTITGDINNNNGIIAFIHGFPDFGYIWDKQIDFFRSKNYCCISLELPNFQIDRIQNPWGYQLLTVVDALGNTLKQILDKKDCSLITHDWGALFGQLLYLKYKRKISFRNLVLLDVADGAHDDPEQEEKYVYQSIQATAFLLPTFIGSWVLRRFWRRFGLIPLFEKEKQDDKVYFASYCAYPYYYMKDVLKGESGGYVESLAIAPRLNEFDGLPILFIDANGLRFYSQKFKNFLESRSYCKFVEFDDCRHWQFMTDKSDKANDTIYDFLQNN